MVSGVQCQASVFSHGRGNELQLEVLILEDAVESRATLGATERPVAVTAAILGEFCKEGQLQRRGHTLTKVSRGRQPGWRGVKQSRGSLVPWPRIHNGQHRTAGCRLQGCLPQTSNVTLGKFISLLGPKFPPLIMRRLQWGGPTLNVPC